MKTISFVFSLFIASICFVACSEQEEISCELGPEQLVLCITVYDPVCGCNNITYGNDCIANAAGVPSYTPGECP